MTSELRVRQDLVPDKARVADACVEVLWGDLAVV